MFLLLSRVAMDALLDIEFSRQIKCYDFAILSPVFLTD